MESLGDRTPTHKVLIYVSGHKTNIYKLSASSRAARIPPPDGEVILPTSGRFRRRLLTRNSRDAPRGRPHTVVTLPSFVARLERLCWRQPEYGNLMVLLLNRCIGAAGRWLGRPSWLVRCVGVSDISMHTGRGGRGVDIPHEGCSHTGGYGVDVAGRCRVSSRSSSGPATRTP